MRYDLFTAYSTHPLQRPATPQELMDALYQFSDITGIEIEMTEGPKKIRNRPSRPFGRRTAYSQPQLACVFEVPNMHIVLRAVPVRKADMDSGTNSTGLYKAVRFYQAPRSQRFRDYRKSADAFASRAKSFIDEVIYPLDTAG